MESNSRENIVFFFGAGASYEDKAPLAKDLLRESLNLENRLVRENQQDGLKSIQNIKKFLREVYLNECSDYSSLPTFEEVLSPIEIAIEEEKSEFSNCWNLKQLEELKTDLIYCICEVLRDKLREPRGYHDKFIKRIYDLDSEIRKNYDFVFLSSNYDILLDNALKNHRKYVDYQLKPHVSKMSNKDQVILLKLHGSLNWKHYPYGTSKEDTEEYIETEIDKCNFKYPQIKQYSEENKYCARPLIIPPTFKKQFRSNFLKNVWDRADIELEKASKIIFIGYSMPDSDFHIKYLMLRSLSRTNIRPEILVVGRKDDSKTEPQSYQNYRRIFGKIEPLPIGFKGFIEKFHKYI